MSDNAKNLSRLHSANEDGSSLIEALIACGLLIASIVMASTMVVQSMDTMRHLDLMEEVKDLKKWISANTDCTRTFAPLYNRTTLKINCASFNSLLKHDGTRLWSSTNTKLVNGWKAEISCDETQGVKIEVEKNSASGTVSVDPLTKKPLDRTNSSLNPLIGPGSFAVLCPEYFGFRPRVYGADVPVNDSRPAVRAALTANYITSATCNRAMSSGTTDSQLDSIAAAHNSLDFACAGICASTNYNAVSGFFSSCTGGPHVISCICVR